MQLHMEAGKHLFRCPF